MGPQKKQKGGQRIPSNTSSIRDRSNSNVSNRYRNDGGRGGKAGSRGGKGFQVGPTIGRGGPPKGTYLGNIEKIKKTLIHKAKVKKAYYKELAKMDPLPSNLPDDPVAEGVIPMETERLLGDHGPMEGDEQVGHAVEEDMDDWQGIGVEEDEKMDSPVRKYKGKGVLRKKSEEIRRERQKKGEMDTDSPSETVPSKMAKKRHREENDDGGDTQVHNSIPFPSDSSPRHPTNSEIQPPATKRRRSNPVTTSSGTILPPPAPTRKEQEAENRLKDRKEWLKRNKKGQPNLGARVGVLLGKIQKRMGVQ